MSTLVIIAVDGPNVHHQQREFYGKDVKLNFGRLREALALDATTHGPFGSEVELRTAVFQQGQAARQQTEDSIASRERFQGYLRAAGWEVIEQLAQDYPIELAELHALLAESLVVTGEKVVSDIEAASKCLEVVDGRLGKLEEEQLLNVFRDAAADLAQVYSPYYRLTTRLRLRWSLRFLCANLRWPAFRRRLEDLLVRAWSEIGQAERGQADYTQHVRSALGVALESPVRWTHPQLDVADLSDQKVVLAASVAVDVLAQDLKKLRVARDVDQLLGDWVVQQVRPDMGKPARLPATVYLVGNDYRNHLPLAERMQRYGVRPVLVVFKSHLKSANPNTQEQVARYPTLWLDSYIEPVSQGQGSAA